MTNEITKKLVCIVMRNNVEIWVEEERIESLRKALPLLKEHKFIGIDDEMLNTADIVGIFSAQTMEDTTRRKNGQWQCKYNYWHERGEQCAHEELGKYNKK